MSRKESKERKQEMLKLMREVVRARKGATRKEYQTPAVSYVEKLVRTSKLALKHNHITLSEFQEETKLAKNFLR